MPDTGAYRRNALQPGVTYTFEVFARYENMVGEIGATISGTTLPPGEIIVLEEDGLMALVWSQLASVYCIIIIILDT